MIRHLVKNTSNSLIQNTPFHECSAKIIWQFYCLSPHFICWKIGAFSKLLHPLIMFRKLFIKSANNLPNYIIVSIFVLIL